MEKLQCLFCGVLPRSSVSHCWWWELRLRKGRKLQGTLWCWSKTRGITVNSKFSRCMNRYRNTKVKVCVCKCIQTCISQLCHWESLEKWHLNSSKHTQSQFLASKYYSTLRGPSALWSHCWIQAEIVPGMARTSWGWKTRICAKNGGTEGPRIHLGCSPFLHSSSQIRHNLSFNMNEDDTSGL